MKLRVGTILTAVAVLLVFSAIAFAQAKPRIAVLEFVIEGVAKSSEGSSISEEIRAAFVNSNRYTVIDRTLTNKIMKEWDTQQFETADRDRAIKIGKLYNISQFVTGKLIGLSSEAWMVSAVIINGKSGEVMEVATVRHKGNFLRLIDTKLGSLANKFVGATKKMEAASYFRFYDQKGNETSLSKKLKLPEGIPLYRMLFHIGDDGEIKNTFTYGSIGKYTKFKAYGKSKALLEIWLNSHIYFKNGERLVSEDIIRSFEMDKNKSEYISSIVIYKKIEGFMKIYVKEEITTKNILRIKRALFRSLTFRR